MLSQIVKIGADATGFHRVVAGVANVTNKAFAAVGKEITNRFLGAFAAGAVIDRITGFVKDTVDYADNLGDLAENLGITTEEVQRLQVASGLAGVKFTKLLGVIDKINAAQAQAADGSDKKAVALFARLGLDPKTATAMDIMRAAINDQAAGADLLGKRFNNVANVMEKLKTLGPIDIITQEQIDALGRANDQLDEAERKLKVAAATPVAAAYRTAAAGIEFSGKPGAGFAFNQPLIGAAIFAASKAFNRYFGSNVQQAAKSTNGPSGPPPPIAAPPLSLALQSDALSRIGLFVGGRTSVADQMVTIGNYQLSELRAIRQSIQEANR